MPAPAIQRLLAPLLRTSEPQCGPTHPDWWPAACRHVLLALLWLAPIAGNALPGDRDQPIHITADKALRDEVEGVTVYSGNVELVQGSMELEADKLTIYHNTDVADSWEREGEDVEFFRQFSPDGYALGINVLLYAMTH